MVTFAIDDQTRCGLRMRTDDAAPLAPFFPYLKMRIRVSLFPFSFFYFFASVDFQTNLLKEIKFTCVRLD